MSGDTERLRELAMRLDGLVTESLHPAAGTLDTLSTGQILRMMNRDDAQIAESVEAVIPDVEAAAELVFERLRAGGRLFYLGAGTSGRLGVLDASECPPTFGSDPEQVTGVIAGGRSALVRSSEGAEDDPEWGWNDLKAEGAQTGDVVVGITASTRTPYVVGGLTRARSEGLRTVYLTCNPEQEEGVEADVTIHPVLGPEIIAGSTRLKAGTATKLILNMISTAAFVRLGKTWGNLMVDIRPVSDKLRARARRIVMVGCGVGFEEADRALRLCDEEVRTAILSLLVGLHPDDARTRLKAAAGRLRDALDGRGPTYGVEEGEG